MVPPTGQGRLGANATCQRLLKAISILPATVDYCQVSGHGSVCSPGSWQDSAHGDTSPVGLCEENFDTKIVC